MSSVSLEPCTQYIPGPSQRVNAVTCYGGYDQKLHQGVNLRMFDHPTTHERCVVLVVRPSGQLDQEVVLSLDTLCEMYHAASLARLSLRP